MIKRHRISWRRVGSGSRIHAVTRLERGRLNFTTLCGRETAGSQPGVGLPECGACAAQVEPLVGTAA